MEYFEVILVFLYLTVILILAFVLKTVKGSNEYYRKYFMKGLVAKLFGGLAFALVYTYYYTYGGDTMSYYRDAQWITSFFFEDPFGAIDIMLNPAEVEGGRAREVIARLRMGYRGGEFVVIRTTSLLNVLGMNSYFTTTLLFATFSYVGVWHFFLVFAKRFPEIAGQLAIAILFMPSVFFWGSGVMKDTLVIGYLGMLVYSLDKFLIGGVQRLFWAALIFYCGWVIFSVKAYVIMALVPALLIWVIMNFKDRIKDKFFRAAIVPVLFGLAAVGVSLSLNILGQYQEKYSVEKFLSSARSIQNWHYIEGENTSDNHGRGSSYTLGEYEPTLMGVLKKFPAAVNVTLFRPYFWEVRNGAMVISALESTLILLFSVYIFLGLGLFRILRLTVSDPFLLMSLSFAILFAFSVGFTSYNFGALARYKIPCIPFYISSLLILHYKVKLLKQKRKQTSQSVRKEEPRNIRFNNPKQFA